MPAATPGEAVLETDPQAAVTGPDSCLQRGQIVQRDGRRLLKHDMAAVPQGLDCQRDVRVVRGADVDHVDLMPGQQLAEASIAGDLAVRGKQAQQAPGGTAVRFGHGNQAN